MTPKLETLNSGVALEIREGDVYSLDTLFKGRLNRNLVQEIEKAPIKFQGSQEDYFQALCDYYSEELRNRLPVIPEEVRHNNINSINRHQEEMLQKHLEPNIKVEKEKRRLNLYFRTGTDGRRQMDPFEFGIITWILAWYIQNGRSRTFNALSIVSRLKENYPHFVHSFSPEIEYLDVAGEEFNRACSVGTNTIHLTHGTPIENRYFSVPILGRSTREDSMTMESCKEFVPLRLYYPEAQRPHARDVKLEENDYSGSFKMIMEETIRAVQALEDKLLIDAEAGNLS